MNKKYNIVKKVSYKKLRSQQKMQQLRFTVRALEK